MHACLLIIGIQFPPVAGFELGAIDKVPCFISKEPDIENDME
jgi:hypothetical protein